MGTYALAGIAAIGVTVLALAGSLLPPLLAARRPDIDVTQSLFFRGSNGFAAGVVVCVAYVHSFTDAQNDLSQVTDFPWAGVTAMIGTVITFLVEQGVAHFLGLNPHGHGSDDPKSEEEKDSIKVHQPNYDAIDLEHQALEQQQENAKFRIEMYTLLFGLSFHSIFVGFAVGIQPDDVPLLVAVIAHQFFEGVALGMRVAQARLDRKITIIIVDLIYTLMTPLGIGIGVWANSITLGGSDFGSASLSASGSASDQPVPSAFLVLAGLSNGISAGILIYVGLLHMVVEELQRASKDRKAQLVIYGGFILGAIFMTLIALWA